MNKKVVVNSLNPRLFFVHIQKTAGGTLREYIKSNLIVGSVYPGRPYETGSYDFSWDIPALTKITSDRMDTINAFSGHFPYFAAEMVNVPTLKMSVLREPIERTLSYLRMRAKNPGRTSMSLEEIYDHPLDFKSFIHNHQTKIFSFTRSDNVKTFMAEMDFDQGRFELAKENLNRIDILGLQEDIGAIFKQLEDRFGWLPAKVKNKHVTDKSFEVSESFKQRIAEDNAMEIEFYQYAKALYFRRKKAGFKS